MEFVNQYLRDFVYSSLIRFPQLFCIQPLAYESIWRMVQVLAC